MWCGSRTQWKRAPGSVVSGEIAPNNAWWEALKQNPWIEAWCKDNPGIVLYGEVFGPGIQPGFTYGLQPKQVGFVVFDILCKGQWVNNREFVQPNYAGLNFVPVIYDGPYSPSVVEELAEVNETFGNAGHIREGVVIKTHVERFDPEIGRIALKHVSNRYFEAK
jgi:RNA ligase (TIGR02306 family)